MGHKVATLSYAPFDTYGSGLLVGGAPGELGCKRLGNVAAKHPRQHCELAACDNRLDTGNDGDSDAFCTAAGYEIAIFLIVRRRLKALITCCMRQHWVPYLGQSKTQ